MSSRTISYYRYFCNTENIYVYNWNDCTPVCCPNDITHHIDNNSVSVIDSVDSNTTTINQKSGDIEGNYRVESKVIYIPANQTSSVVLSWPFNISIMTLNWTSSQIHKGDIINGFVAENTIIGKITKQTNIGDTVLHVSPSVFEHINKGYLVSVTDGQQSINMEQCISMDKAAGIITCENSVTTSLNAGSYLQITVNNIRNFHILEPESVRLANKHLSSSPISAGTKVKFQYQNNGSIPKTFVFQYEYLY